MDNNKGAYGFSTSKEFKIEQRQAIYSVDIADIRIE